MSRNAVFNVRLTRPSAGDVYLDYTTVPNTATAPSDFTATTGTLHFAPGQIAAQIVVPVRDDIPGTGAEAFSLQLSSPVGASINDGHGDCVLPATAVYSQPYASIDNPLVGSST